MKMRNDGLVFIFFFFFRFRLDPSFWCKNYYYYFIYCYGLGMLSLCVDECRPRHRRNYGTNHGRTMRYGTIAFLAIKNYFFVIQPATVVCSTIQSIVQYMSPQQQQTCKAFGKLKMQTQRQKMTCAMYILNIYVFRTTDMGDGQSQSGPIHLCF